MGVVFVEEQAKLDKVYVAASPVRPFESYEEEHRRGAASRSEEVRMVEDLEHGIVYETREIADRARVLLDVHCPICVQRCGSDRGRLRELTPLRSMANLRRHLQDAHGGRKLCDVCVACRKVFACEQRTYTTEELRRHNREGDPGVDGVPPIPPHPYCDLCRKGFLAPDDLYAHLEREHVLCRVCFSLDRERGVAQRDSAGVSDDPDSAVESACARRYLAHRGLLRVHEDAEHFPCPDPVCRAQGMVFAHRMDRDGHVATVHRGGVQLDGKPLPGMHAAAAQRGKGKQRGRAVPLPMDSFFAGGSATDAAAEGRSRRDRRPPPPCFVFDPVTGYGRLDRWNSRGSSRHRRQRGAGDEEQEDQDTEDERQSSQGRSEEDVIMRQSASEAAFAIDAVQKDVAAAGGGRAEAAVKRRLNGQLTDQLARSCEEAAAKQRAQPGPSEAADSIQRRILDWSSSFHRESLSASEYHRLLQSELGAHACWKLVPLLSALHPNPTAREQLRKVFIDAARMQAVREFHQQRGRQALDRSHIPDRRKKRPNRRRRAPSPPRNEQQEAATPRAAVPPAPLAGRNATQASLPEAAQPAVASTTSSTFPIPGDSTSSTFPVPGGSVAPASASTLPPAAETARSSSTGDHESLAWSLVCLRRARTFLEVRVTPLLTSRKASPQDLRLTPYEKDALEGAVAAAGDPNLCLLPVPEFSASSSVEMPSEASVKESLSWLQRQRCILPDAVDLLARTLVHFHATILRQGTVAGRPSKKGKAKGKAERALAQAASESRPRCLLLARVLCDCLLGEVQARLGDALESSIGRIESLLETSSQQSDARAPGAEPAAVKPAVVGDAPGEDHGWRSEAKTNAGETRSIRAPRVVRKTSRRSRGPVARPPAAAPAPPTPELWFDSQRRSVGPPPGLGGESSVDGGPVGPPRPSGAWSARSGGSAGAGDPTPVMMGKGKKKKKKTKGADKRGIRLL